MWRTIEAVFVSSIHEYTQITQCPWLVYLDIVYRDIEFWCTLMYFDPGRIDAIKTVNNDYNNIRYNIVSKYCN